ncbi:MAG: DegT/DnrJ/EryC1/StrS family aminotransferase [Verrucomicrobiota bacterium]
MAPERVHVPLIDVRAQNELILSELESAAQRVIRSGGYILGGENAALEEEVSAHLGVDHAVAVSSGTDAILLSLMALGIGPGDEVICPSFTFFATASCVSRLGATPVFADVELESFNLDPAAVEAKLSERTKAVIPVHLFGQTADLNPVLKLSESHGLHVIEDAAQAFGAEHEGRKCGTLGDFGTYSFFPTKNLGGLGDGGMLVTNDPELAATARLLRNHGMNPKYYYPSIGGNFRMDELHAAMLRVKLGHIEAWEKARAKNAESYRRDFADENETSIIPPMDCGRGKHVWNQFTLRIPDGRRDALKAHLFEEGISSEIYYPLPLHRQQCFAELGAFALEGNPRSETLGAEVLSIPVFPELTKGQRESVVAAIRSFVA